MIVALQKSVNFNLLNGKLIRDRRLRKPNCIPTYLASSVLVSVLFVSVCVREDTEHDPRQLPKYVIWQAHYAKFSMLSEWLLCFWRAGLVHFLNAYQCNLSICMLSQNAEWVQIAVMKLFHYGDEQCWINRNNKAECFIEPSVEVLWQGVLLCLQHWWLAGGQRWLLAKWNNSHLQLPLIYKQS